MRKRFGKTLSVLLSLVLLLGCVLPAAAPVVLAGVTADGGLPTLTFYVPETIYLKASDNKTFQYFVNREQTDAGALRTSQDTTGLIYFKCADATAVTNLTCGGASVNLSTTTPSDTTLKATVNSGALSSAIALNGTVLVPWTVTFTLGGKSRTATAYSVAYAPNRSVTMNASYGWAYNNDHRAYASSLIFIQGAHVTPAAYANKTYPSDDLRTIHYRTGWQYTDGSYYIDPLANGVSSATNGTGPLTWIRTGGAPFTGASASVSACQCIRYVSDEKYPSSTQWTAHCDYNPASAEITVDKSRYSNTNQVPNLKLGFRVTDWDNVNSRKNWFVSDATSQIVWDGSTPTLPTVRDTGYGTQDILKHDYWQKDGMAYACFEDRQGTVLACINNATLGGGDGNGSVGEKYRGAISCDLTSLSAGSTAFRLFRGGASGLSTDAYATSFCAVSLKITAVDKGSLRSLVNTCIGSYLQQHYTSSTWSAYKTALENAAKVLGNPMASVSDISSAVSTLTAAKDGLVRGTGTATVTHKTASGIVFDTETANYDYGQTVTVTSKSYTGYSFTGSSPASLVEGDMSSATATWDLTYTPIDYALSYELNGGDAENPASYNIETPDFTLARPTKTAYTFLGWTGTDVDDPTLDVTVAQGSVGARSFEANWEPTAYTLTPDAQGGECADEIGYTIESDAVIPEPTRAGYDFAGWTVTEAEGTWTVGDTPAPGAPLAGNWGDATLTAAWTVRHDTSYTVNHYYMNADGTYPDVPQSQVFTGTTENVVTAASAASVPAHYSLDTENSDEEISILGDGSAALNLYYKLDRYTVTFNVDGTETCADYYYGAVPAYGGETPALDGGAQYTYTFLGWTAEPADPGAQVTFYTTLPAVTCDATYYPYFGATVNSYDITFIVDGAETVQSFPYGATPEFGATPAKDATAQYTYTFSGWEPAIEAVTGEATYTAQFDETLNRYPVFVSGGVGSAISLASGNYDYGTELDFTVTVDEAYSDSEPAVTVGDTVLRKTGKEGLVFSYTVTVTGETEISVSDLEKNTYTVIFTVNGTDTEKTVAYGDTPVYGGTPAKDADAQYTYTFTGWEPEIVPATADAAYTAKFDPAVRSYTVTFIVEGASTALSFAYGETPAFGFAPAKASDDTYDYTFSGWSAEENGAVAALAEVTGDATYYAVFTATPIPAHEHDFSTFVRTVAATCVSGGYDEYICECGMTEQRNLTAVDAANHAKSAITVGYRAATAEADGYTGDQICPACGVTVVGGEIIPRDGAHVHAFDTLVRHTDATCCAKAVDEYVCACGETKLVEGDAPDPDNHVGLTTVGAREATTEEYGYTGDRICTACGAVLASGEVIEKLVVPHTHSFDTVIESHEATCVAKAYEIRKCACGETKRVETGEIDPENHVGEIRLLGHRDATAEAEGYTGDKYCLTCGKLVEAGETIDRLPDPDEPVEYEHGCPICGEEHDGNIIQKLIGLVHTFLFLCRKLFKLIPAK